MSEAYESSGSTSEWMDGSTIPPRHHTAVPQKRRKSRSGHTSSSSLASAELSFEDMEHNEMATNASKRAQKLQEFIYNNTDCSIESKERLETLSDLADTLLEDEKLNLAAWEVIDREITEWQKVCGSGRPSWWSPVTKRNRVHQAYASNTEDSVTLAGGETRRRTVALRRSRALSDSVLPNTTRLQDLAYLIAIQLLSACPTLPPENITEPALSSYPYYRTDSAKDLPDPSMISALRMHTHFRYTPGFGHHARNNSMANLWAGLQDGRCTPMLASIHFKPLGIHEPDPRQQKRRRVRRILNTTQVSLVDDGPLGMHDGSADDGEPLLSSTAWDRRKGVLGDRELELPTAQEQRRINISLPPSPRSESARNSPPSANKSIYTHRHRSKEGVRSTKKSKKDHDVHVGNSDGQRESLDRGTGSNSKSLESQIRSEPHPVFVQPVKELVVKKWRTFRSRFGNNGPSPDPSSTSNDFLAETAGSNSVSSDQAQYVGNLRLKSPPGMFAPAASVGPTNDGKERRRRARKASDMHVGSSSNGDPRFNTPMMSEDEETVDGYAVAMDVRRASSPTVHLLDPLVDPPASEATLQLSLLQDASAPSNSMSAPLIPARRGSAAPRSQSPRSQSLSSFSPRGAPNRSKKNRKSLLSEMHTAETFDSRPIEMIHFSSRPPLSVAGSLVNSPNRTATGTPTQTPGTERMTYAFDAATPGPGSTPFDETPETPMYIDWSAGNEREQAVQALMRDKLAMEEAELLEKAAALEEEREALMERAAALSSDRRESLKDKTMERGRHSSVGTARGVTIERLSPRPRLVRMSTSGTSHFTPKDDGVEIDGLPVGPGLEESGWRVGKIKGDGDGERRGSSFL